MRRAVACILSIVVLASTASAGDQPYLFDMLKKPAYRAAWDALLTGEKDVPPWLAKYAKTLNGPSGPGQMVRIRDSDYQLNDVCKTHDCGNNYFIVLFAPSGQRAWGLLRINGDTQRFFGNPDEEKKRVMSETD